MRIIPSKHISNCFKIHLCGARGVHRDPSSIEREAGTTGIVVTLEQQVHASKATPELCHIEELCMLPLHLAEREATGDWSFTMLK